MSTKRAKWSREAIVADLQRLKERGAKPDIFTLKSKYRFEMNSEFFPLLDELGKVRRLGLGGFVEGIFRRVKDPRDLDFRHGGSIGHSKYL